MIFDAFILSRAISVAAKLGIADLLKADAKTADELAQATGVHTPSLYRVLRALASAGIFAEDEAGRFHLTPLAERCPRQLACLCEFSRLRLGVSGVW